MIRISAASLLLGASLVASPVAWGASDAAHASPPPSVDASPSGGVSVGDPFPDFEIAAWINNAGEESSIHDLRGRLILIDFWRTW